VRAQVVVRQSEPAVAILELAVPCIARALLNVELNAAHHSGQDVIEPCAD
jgi:hypothetical protein